MDSVMRNRPVLKLAYVACYCIACSSAQSAESASSWNYPGSKLRAEAGPSEAAPNPRWPNESIQIRSTADSVAKVVAYYVDQSGFQPPNWKILGREFPDSQHLPAGFWIGPGKTSEGPARVSIIHDLRPEVAQVTFLVISDTGVMRSISVTRSKREDATWIQVHEHTAK